MKHRRLDRRIAFVLACAGLLIASAPALLARAGEERLHEEVAISGLVVAPNGSAAAGAVVVTSAGGQAVTDARGEFRLRVTVSDATDRLQVTAVSADSTGLVATRAVAIAGASVSAGTLTLAASTTCDPSWLPTFGGAPGTTGIGAELYALQVFDDGNGPALYVGGSFSIAGGVPVSHIARWDGARWSRVGSGDFIGPATTIKALAVFDDGSGPALYAGGGFNLAGGVPAQRIAKWDGLTWSPLGTGIDAGVFPIGTVEAMAVWDDGTGDALYVGGTFQKAGSVAASRVARWDGTTWSALGSGLDDSGDVFALQKFDDGSGSALYVGGDFTSAGGAPANFVARWNGASWSAVGGGVSSTSSLGSVQALAVFDGGVVGPALYAAGRFDTAGVFAASNIARWNGTTWEPVGAGLGITVLALQVYDDGGGLSLYAAGTFGVAGGAAALRIAEWDGSSWSEVGGGILGSGILPVNALAVFDGGDGPELFAAGRFGSAGGLAANDIARWDGTSWGVVGNGLDQGVNALAVFDDGSGPALHAAGRFEVASGQVVNAVAKWNGASWEPLGGGVDSWVYALAVFDDGSGEALYAGGDFRFAGAELVNRVARWDGASWSSVGGGVVNPEGFSAVLSFAVFDDGGGDELYVGGSFTEAGGTRVNNVAKWDGSTWTTLNRGVNSSIETMVVFDDGSGPALFAGGQFTVAGNKGARRVAKWDGTSWDKLGSGANSAISALAVFDDGGGPELYAGGFFTMIGAAFASRVAKWNGVGWAALGTGVDNGVWDLAVHDDGSGPALYAAGSFDSAGGMAAQGVAKWNGFAWSPLGGGVDGANAFVLFNAYATSLLSFDDGAGPALYLGGEFAYAVDSGDSYVAKWACADVPALVADVPTISLTTGGQQAFALDAGSGAAGWFYTLLGSVTGTSPGLDFGGGVLLPLNVDVYFDLTLAKPGLGAFGNFRGTLDGSGEAQATLTLPALGDPSLVGVILHHAYLAGSTPGVPEFASNAVSLELVL